MFDSENPYIPLDAAAYKEMRDAGTKHLLLDVREPNEYAEAHISGATLIPMNDVLARLDELEGYDTIVVQCRSGKRSAMVATALHDENVAAKIYNLEGGIVAWANAGNPYESGE